MNFFSRKNKKKNKENNNSTDKPKLREFVYLDEISLISMLSSQSGFISEELVDTKINSLGSELNSTIGASAGVVKAEINPNINVNMSNSSQVLKKSTIQGLFKEFYEAESNSLILKSNIENNEDITINSKEDLSILKQKLIEQNILIDSELLKRGSLLELEVELETESIYQLYTIFNSFSDIFNEDIEILGVKDIDFLEKMDSIIKIIEKLLFGLIPIRGKVRNYAIVSIEGKKYILNKSNLKINSVDLTPLYVVGVTELSLFWKDIRRILYSKNNYYVFCRLTNNSIQESWTPIKLVNVIEEHLPDVAKQINTFGDNLSLENKKSKSENNKIKFNFKNVLLNFSKELAATYNIEYSEEISNKIEFLATNLQLNYESDEKRRDSFNLITELIINNSNIEKDYSVISNLRINALRNEGFNMFGKLEINNLEENIILKEQKNDNFFIDSEFIAIYW